MLTRVYACAVLVLGMKACAPAPAPAQPRPPEASRCETPFPRNVSAPRVPPYEGTAFIGANILTARDPTSFAGLTDRGQGTRTMWDRRVEGWVTLEAHLFEARFGRTVTVEVQVNPEMTHAVAEREARRYAEVIGRLPAFYFRDLDTVWIHRGVHLFGGGNRNVLIHTDQGERYDAHGVLEEMLLHEAAHTSLEAYHANLARWQEAQRADGGAISVYARDHLAREDVAESIVAYVAQRFFADRVAPAELVRIRAAIPARIAYFDCLGLSAALVP